MHNMFIIRLAADALSSVSESEQGLLHLPDKLLPTSHYESMKTGEIIIEKADSAKKCLHSIKRVHRLIEEELMMEYDMKTTNNIITNTTDNVSSSNRGNKLSRYHEKNEFCTPYSIDQSKKDASTTSTTTERSILTTKKCSSTTSLLYDLLSGRENFDSVYMRSQLVFVTCDNSKSLTSNLKKDDILTRRRVTNSHIQRRRKSLKPTKHYNSSQPTEISVSTGENLFQNNQLSEKLSSSSPLSSSSISSSSPSSSSSSSMLSPLNMNILTRPQISPKKLIDKLECLKTSCILHSESPVKHCSLVHTTTSISGTTTTSTNINNQEQPLDLSSASSYFNQSGLLSNIPYKSLNSKRRRSFAGDLNYSSRLSDYSNIIRCNSSRHNSVTLPLSPTDSNFIKCFSSPSTTTTTISSTNVNTNNNCNLKSECKSPEEYPCKLNVNNQLNDESTFIGANLLDLFLSPAYYQVALSTALALCASSIFHSFDNTLNRTINNLPNSYNHLKTAYELAYEQLLTLTNYSKDTTINLSSVNDQSNLSELSQTTSLNETINHQSNIIQHKQQSVSIQSNFNVKYNTLTTLKTGDNIQHSKKSLTKLCFMTKNTENNNNNNNNRITKLLNSKTNSLSFNRILNQHSNNQINHNTIQHTDNDNDKIVNYIKHSFITSSIKNSNQNSILLNTLKQWFIQMINIIEQPKSVIISLLQDNITQNKTTTTTRRSIFNLFNERLLDQSFEIRLQLLNASWYRLLIVYLIEYKQLSSWKTEESSFTSSSPSTLSHLSLSVDEDKLVRKKKKKKKKKKLTTRKFPINKFMKSKKKKSTEIIHLFHDIQAIASICYSLKFSHSIYSLIRIGLLILGVDQQTQCNNDVHLLEQLLLEYMVLSTEGNEKSTSSLHSSSSSSQNCREISANECDDTNTTTSTTNGNTDMLNCTSVSNSSSGSSDNNSIDVIPTDKTLTMIHTLIVKLLKLTKESIIFFVSNQLGDSVEDLFTNLVEISLK